MSRSFSKFLRRQGKRILRRKHNGRRNARARLAMEPLEDRQMFAVSIGYYAMGADFGVSIEGAGTDDEVIVSDDGGNLLIQYRTKGDPVFQESYVTGIYSGGRPLPTRQVFQIRFHGNGGDDSFTNGTDIWSQAFGGEGNDTLQGGSIHDELHGEAGNDELRGGDGWDRLYGGPGYDILLGEGDRDFLDGGGTTQNPEANFLNVAADPGSDFNAHEWVINGAVPDDVMQESSNTCSFLATLAAVAGTGGDLADRITYLGNSVYQVQLFEENLNPVSYQVTFDGALTAGDPAPATEGEFWTVLYQRAYLQYLDDHGDVIEDIGQEFSPGFSFTGTGLTALTGQSYERHGMGGTDQQHLDRINNALAAGRPIVAVVWAGSSTPRLTNWHAYTVIGTDVDPVEGNRIILRNPWGDHDVPLDSSGAAPESGYEASGPGNDLFDGIVSVPLGAFDDSMYDYYIGNVGGQFDVLFDTSTLAAGQDSMPDTLDVTRNSAGTSLEIRLNGQLSRSVPLNRVNSLHLFGSDAVDTFRINVGGLQFPIFADARGDHDQLIVRGSAAADTLTVSPGEVTASVTANTHISYSSFRSVQLDGMNGNDSITVEGAAMGIDLTVNGGNHHDNLFIRGTVSHSVTLNGDHGSDTINISGVTSGGSDTIIANGGSHNDRIVIADASAHSRVNVHGGTAPGDTLVGPNTADNDWRITGAGAGTVRADISFDEIEKLVGGSERDIFTMTSTAGAGISSSINGGGSVDTLNYASYPGPVTVDLAAGTATAAGNLGSVEDFVGTSAADRLVSTVANNTWNITNNNRGNITSSTSPTISFASFEHLQGGPYLDTFVLAAGRLVSGSLDGGNGQYEDTLDYSAWSGVTVDLDAGTASGVGGGASNTVLGIEYLVGSPGNDTLAGNSSDNLIRGGAGNDVLRGGGGNDILLGESGGDRLEGGAGRDLLIGGTSRDTLFGGLDDDILIGGRTVYDAQDHALREIMEEWTRDIPYNDRVNHLSQAHLEAPGWVYDPNRPPSWADSPNPAGTALGHNGTTFLDDTTVLDDGIFDSLYGEGGNNWLWYEPPQTFVYQIARTFPTTFVARRLF